MYSGRFASISSAICAALGCWPGVLQDGAKRPGVIEA